MPIHHFIFYIFISVSYIDTAGKTIRNASNLTVVAVKFRGETTPTSAVFQRFILIGRDKNPPNPLSQRGDLAWLMTLTEAETSNASVFTFLPLKKGGQGGFSTDVHSFQSEHIYTQTDRFRVPGSRL